MTQPPAQPTSQRPPPAAGPPGLADRLREVVVDLRSELDITRHVFRAGPAYIIRDPITFATHRFDPGDYRVIASIRSGRTLGETFERLVAEGELERSDEEGFYGFVLDLHQRSLLTLPINNADALYQRYEKRLRAERLSKVLGVFFLRVPLFNPDRLLSRTLPLFRWMFAAPGLVLWSLLMLAAGGVALARWDDLISPDLAVIEGSNLIMLWAVLIGLKVVHEFGHGYACKSYGGHVPEMGAFFILFTPVAYVDATDSWTFTSTRRRAIVILGGVYFESIIGAIALFVWAATEPSTLNTLAHQVIILATVTTLIFNLNPLLRYDAYYLVSDLCGVPNLRARCQEALAGTCKRFLFGLPADTDGHPHRYHPGLVLFGSAQMAYRVLMMLTITTVLILKFGGLGILLALLMVGMTLGKALTGLTRYVFVSEETAPVRTRAALSTFGLAALAVVALLTVPLPWPVQARGVVSFERVEPIRAARAGVVADLPADVGRTRQPGDPIAVLTDPDTLAELDALNAERLAHDGRITHAALTSTAKAMSVRTGRDRLDARIGMLTEQADALVIAAPEPGRVLDVIVPGPGAFVPAGDPIVLYASGAPEAVFHVRAFEFDTLTLKPGDTLVCRSPADPSRRIAGEVISIGAVGSREVEPRIRHAAPGGLVPLDAATGEAMEPYFEIRVRLPERDAALAGISVQARLPAQSRTTAAVIERRVVRFLNRVKEGSDG